MNDISSVNISSHAQGTVGVTPNINSSQLTNRESDSVMKKVNDSEISEEENSEDEREALREHAEYVKNTKKPL